MTAETNKENARRLSEKILSMDYFSAQLRLTHNSHLREGDFDAERLRTIVAYLQEIEQIAAACIPLAAALTPTVTLEPAPAPEKEPQQ
ncbi:MAG TPA: hypothetical protein PK228_15885 [Saprospiraceae bacterium]|nr:hypothetical protein [Saprospiraceae bacterium]